MKALTPSSTRTLHLPQVPRPPQVLSMASHAQFAALNTVVPSGAFVTRFWGRNVTGYFNDGYSKMSPQGMS
jgi:hypothetical protein